MIQQTLVLIKPDAMERRLGGEVIARIERTGLRIVNCKMHQADEKLAAAHYPVTDAWYQKAGGNTLKDCEAYGLDPMAAMGTSDPIEIGKKIHKFNIEFLTSGKVVALVFEGPHAVELVRKLVGSTVPLLSAPGTIRGDFSSESAVMANFEKRPIHNLVHASGDVEEAKREIELWFGEWVAIAPLVCDNSLIFLST